MNVENVVTERHASKRSPFARFLFLEFLRLRFRCFIKDFYGYLSAIFPANNLFFLELFLLTACKILRLRSVGNNRTTDLEIFS